MRMETKSVIFYMSYLVGGLVVGLVGSLHPIV